MSEPETTWVEVARVPTREAVRELALVLEALGLPSGTVHLGEAHLLVARPADADRARAELSKYANENRAGPRRAESPAPVSFGIDTAVAYAMFLAFAYVLQRRGAFGFDWAGAGAADAGLIRAGAWWRSVTALCLHADTVHLAGNVVFGALFGVMLAHSVGAGTAWLAIAVTGAAGNLANAWMQSPEHVSIGASTAVFGALGVQVAFDWVRRHSLHHDRWRRWAPIAVGVALLAWLGGGGDRGDATIARTVDVGAHVLGFAAGIVAGVLLGVRAEILVRPGRAQVVPGIAAIALVALAWWLALTG